MNWAQLDSNELEKWLNDTSGKITNTDRQEIENILKQRKVADSRANRARNKAIANRQVPDDSAYKSYKNRQAQKELNTQRKSQDKAQDKAQDKTHKEVSKFFAKMSTEDLTKNFNNKQSIYNQYNDDIKAELINRAAETYKDKSNEELKSMLNDDKVSDDEKEFIKSAIDSRVNRARNRARNKVIARGFSTGFKLAGNGISKIIPALSMYAANKMIGRDPMGRSAGLEQQAAMHEQEATDYQKLAQQQAQIANRDYRAEAEKNAVANAAIQNAQAVANMGNTSAGAAALNRNVQAADYNTMMQRQDTMRKEAMDARQRAYDAQQIAQQERTDAKGYDYTAKNAASTNAMMQTLSKGPMSKGINYDAAKTKAASGTDTKDYKFYDLYAMFDKITPEEKEKFKKWLGLNEYTPANPEDKEES